MFIARKRMVAAIAAVALVAVLATHLPTAAAAERPGIMANNYRNHSMYYNIKVVNRMSNQETMEINCRVGMNFSLGKYESSIGSFFPATFVDLYEAAQKRRVTTLPAAPRVYCAWAYAGNYMNKVPIFSAAWPEAAQCTGVQMLCTAVFADGQLFVEAPEMPPRLIGDLAIKRCKWHWLFGLFGSDCSLPRHRHRYAGDVLDGKSKYQEAVADANNF
ncbi:hypothetical protein ACP4OV_031210 [Aristida adscensionis]